MMLINLSDVLSEQHKPIDEEIVFPITHFRAVFGEFKVCAEKSVHIKVTYIEEKRYLLEAETEFFIEIPCNRCLEMVNKKFQLAFTKNIDFADPEGLDGSDETSYIDGYNLDATQLLYNEILIEWPDKVLCNEDCKGICSVCGQNRNNSSCNCLDTGLGPRMSIVYDIFKNFKEV